MPPTAFPSLRRQISASDIRAAEAAVVRAERDWDRFARRTVTAAELDAAQESVEKCDKAVAALSPGKIRKKAVVVGLLATAAWFQQIGERVGRMAGLGTQTIWAGIALAAVIGALPAIGIGFAFKPAVGWFLLLVIGGVALGAGLGAALCNTGTVQWVSSRLTRRRIELTEHRRLVGVARERLTGWLDHLADLCRVRRAHDAVRKATRELAELQALLADERYQLLHSDWRSLRGVPFEEFLARVFTTLGYQIQTTKTSGDQGVDLILFGKGSKIAVQAKGYGGSVGNKAVQEAYAGMTFYSCQRCMVVTNSTFTSGAASLAVSVSCTLIDGSRIPDLIEGKVH